MLCQGALPTSLILQKHSDERTTKTIRKLSRKKNIATRKAPDGSSPVRLLSAKYMENRADNGNRLNTKYFTKWLHSETFSDLAVSKRTWWIKIGRASCRERVCQYV